MRGKTISRISVVALTLFAASSAFAAAPNFCSVDAIKTKEVRMPTSGLTRLHGYQLGSVLLMGLGVGSSSNEAVQKLPSGRQCTWYFNDGDEEATELYNWKDLPKPNSTGDIDELREEYGQALEWILSESSSPFWSCIEERKAVAMGCDGMKHRGPTVFAMMLSFLGCQPADSVAIVNKVWGTNGIPTSNRVALARDAYEYGNANPAKRARALEQFVGKK